MKSGDTHLRPNATKGGKKFESKGDRNFESEGGKIFESKGCKTFRGKLGYTTPPTWQKSEIERWQKLRQKVADEFETKVAKRDSKNCSKLSCVGRAMPQFDRIVMDRKTK